jgi:hypothetical protein
MHQVLRSSTQNLVNEYQIKDLIFWILSERESKPALNKFEKYNPMKKLSTLLIASMISIFQANYGFGQCTVTAISPSTMNAPYTAGQIGTVAVTTQNGCSDFYVSNYTTWVSYTKNGKAQEIRL